MNSVRTAVLVCLLAIPAWPQQISKSSSQAQQLLQNSYNAMAGNTIISDVSLVGNARRIAGSDDESGTVIYRGVAGSGRLDMTLPEGKLSEIRSVNGSTFTGSWIGFDGISHDNPNWNLIIDPGWFPIFSISSVTSATNAFYTYVGPETHNDISAIHLASLQQIGDLPSNLAASLEHLTQVDVYLEASTLLPVAYDFNLHPDDNPSLDIPTEIRYSNYQKIGGVQIPLHVQRYINGSLVLDLQFQTASLNTGITAEQISAQ